MRKRSGLFVLNVIILSAAAGISTPWSGIVVAGDKCFTEPNLQLPQGGHWHYRTDPERHRKCSYVGRSGLQVHQAVRREARLSLKSHGDGIVTHDMHYVCEGSH